MLLEEILYYLLFLYYLGNLEKFIAKGSAKYEPDLEEKTTAAIEQLKSGLTIQVFEHQTRYSKLHKKRAESFSLLSDPEADLCNSIQIFIVSITQPL